MPLDAASDSLPRDDSLTPEGRDGTPPPPPPPRSRSHSRSRTPPRRRDDSPPPPRTRGRSRSLSLHDGDDANTPPPPPRRRSPSPGRGTYRRRSRSRSPPPPPRSERSDGPSGPRFAPVAGSDRDRWASAPSAAAAASDDRRGGGASYGPSSRASLDGKPRYYGYTLPLPDDELVPRLIGKSGRVARQIQTASGVARIALGHLPSPDGRIRPIPVLEFRGTISDIIRAIDGVRQAIIETARPARDGSGGDDVAFGTKYLEEWCHLEPRYLHLLTGSPESSMSQDLRSKLPRNHVPLSIELINRVEQQAWRPRDDGPRRPSPPPAPAATREWGQARSRSPARGDVDRMESKRRRVDDDAGRNGGPDRFAPRFNANVPEAVRNEHFDLEIELPMDAAPAVIGRSGRRMREIHDATKIRCRVQADNPRIPPLLCLSGPVPQMRQALSMVEEVVQHEVDRRWVAPRIGEDGKLESRGGGGGGGRNRDRSRTPPPPPPRSRKSYSRSPMRD